MTDRTPETCVELALGRERMFAFASGVLWLPSHAALVVADLHLGKAERNARRGGGFWPPFETAETLRRLSIEIETLRPQRVVALGDSFDDARCARELDKATRRTIAEMANVRDWVWVAGNHDPEPVALGGRCVAELRLGALTLRHIAEPGATLEISGHFHPKARLRLRGRRVARRCFLTDGNRMILPAFGTYTGGLDICDPVFEPLISPREGVAVLTGERAIAAPLADLRTRAA